MRISVYLLLMPIIDKETIIANTLIQNLSVIYKNYLLHHHHSIMLCTRTY